MIKLGLILLVGMAAVEGDRAASREDSFNPKVIPTPRDGNVAVQEELCIARKAATREAYDIFIARHPKHPLAEIARKERDELPKTRR